MADLRLSDGRVDGHRDRSDRGQLIVIGAILLAITFVALALILNSVIFTENLATRSESLGSSGPSGTQDFVTDNVGSLMTYVNENNYTSSSALQTNMSAGMANLSSILSKQYASTGQLIEIDQVSNTGGTRLWHNNSTQSFTSSAGAEDWDLVDDIDQVRDFTITVNRSGLAAMSECPPGQCFRANVTDQSTGDTWGIAVFDDGGDVNVTSFNQNGPIGSCSISGQQEVRIDLTRGWVGDKRCQEMQFGQGIDLTSELTLNFTNGDQSNGTYSVVVRDADSGLSIPPSGFQDPLALGASEDPPFATEALYSVGVRIRYNTNRIAYEIVQRVAPGEP